MKQLQAGEYTEICYLYKLHLCFFCEDLYLLITEKETLNVIIHFCSLLLFRPTFSPTLIRFISSFLIVSLEPAENIVFSGWSGLFSTLSAVLGCLFSFHLIENTSEGL